MNPPPVYKRALRLEELGSPDKKDILVSVVAKNTATHAMVFKINGTESASAPPWACSTLQMLLGDIIFRRIHLDTEFPESFDITANVKLVLPGDDTVQLVIVTNGNDRPNQIFTFRRDVNRQHSQCNALHSVISGFLASLGTIPTIA